MSDKDHPTTEYDDYGSENNYDTGYTSDDYESGEYEADDYETGDYASDDYDAEYSDSDSYASDDYDAEDGDPEYYDSEQYAASDYDDAYDQGEHDAEPADPSTIDPDTIPPEALEPYYDKSAFKWLKNMNRAKLIRLISMLVFSVAILVFASIAWFTMNKDVGADGMSVKIMTIPFELAVKGSTIRNDSKFSEADTSYTEGDNTALSGYYVSNGSNPQIKVRYNPVENEVTDFGPGSSGQIDFWIVPKYAGDLDVTISLDVIGYRVVGEGNNEEIIRISDLTTTNSGLDQDTINQYKAAENYLKGHILFFEGIGNASQNVSEAIKYYYSDPITDRSLDKSFSNATVNTPIPVTIHWMWSNTLGQIALKDNSTNQRSGYPIVVDVPDDGTDISETDKGKLIQYLKDNKSSVFTNYNNISDTEIDNAKIKENLKKLSDGYNEADFAIGSGVSYFLIEVTVEPAGAE